MKMNEDQHPEGEGLSRRSFLSWGIFLIGSLVGLVLGGSGLMYFLSPAWRKKDEGWIDVGPLASLPSGVPTKRDYVKRKTDGWMVVEGRSSVWLLKDGDQLTAFDPHCTHLGCPYRWDDSKNSFVCPCHSGVFSKTGEVLSGPPPRPLDRFPTKIANGSILILPEGKKA